ncbi:MAG: DUF1501 domain-containing protein [Planctomycetaceae bacterium]|nr:DUF1501 domain-containing protein [Planctomycetaceae bacterium]
MANLPLSRRHLLQLGSLGLTGITLPRLLASEQTNAGKQTAADSCILLFLNGGPSHLDMWDMKPNAPTGIRGEFQPVETSVPGVQFSEHLFRSAPWMHQCSLIRSVHHSVNNAHAAAVYAALTGHDRGELGGGAKPDDHPAIGSVTGQVRPPSTPTVPYVALPYMTQEGRGGPPQPGFFGGWLGRQYDPLFVLKDPNAPDFTIPELTPMQELSNGRLRSRQELQRGFDGSFSEQSASQSLGFGGLQERAFDLLCSNDVQRAFRLSEESDGTREAYGRNIYGQSTLLARRLIEAGTRVVTLSWAPDANATWDTHGSNFDSLKNRLLPQLDLALSSLLKDLVERNMLERTMVVVMGEFGRSPKINNSNGGRDHWNFCYSVLMAGGGTKKGFVYGASDKIGGEPAQNPVGPADIVATIYHQLGIPTDLELYDSLHRPHQLVPWGNPIMEVIG